MSASPLCCRFRQLLFFLFATPRGLGFQTLAPQAVRFQKWQFQQRPSFLQPTSCSHSSSQSNDSVEQQQLFTHDDIDWVLRPFSPIGEDEWTVFRASPKKLIPFLEFPVPLDGKVVLEAWIQESQEDDSSHRNNTKAARFGITVRAGPPHPLLFETIQGLPERYNNTTLEYGASAAIIYMFVEPEFRKQGLGALALQVIGWIHQTVGCSYTVLVADDNGSGRLVPWYERHGLVPAPLLQDLMGSPGAMYGATMIGPVSLLMEGAAGCNDNMPPLPGDFSVRQETTAPPPLHLSEQEEE